MKGAQNMRQRALRLLNGWARAAEAYWSGTAGDPGAGCYGPGYQPWGVQSNLNYAAALATLAAQAAPADGRRWRRRALAALRHALATHVTGSRAGADGKPWGNTWISMLGIERAMHGLAHLKGELSPADQASFRRVLVSEADWLLNQRRGPHPGVSAGLWAGEGRNRPESNIWSGCLLWRVAHLFPGAKNAAEWRTQAHRFLVNGVSIEADAGDGSLVAGHPVSAWHVGANFFPNYALDHHGYLNIGYQVICVSHAAMLHFDFKRAGALPPESLYHHQADLWRVLRRFVFGDGRLARIGGDSRVRYAYCQEYLLPALLFAADFLRDPHALALAGRQIRLMEAEAAAGGGLFYGRRLSWLRQSNPHYFTRLESDRACVLAMLLNYLPLVNPPPEPRELFEESVAGAWIEKAHAAVMHRSPARLASFAWRAHGLTQTALCLPPADGSLAEWELNLCPVVRCLGDDGSGGHRRLLGCTLQAFAGGFVTCGAVMEGVKVSIDEGAACTDQAVTHLAFAALPDERTCVGLQYVVAAADRAVYLAELKDLHAVIPNDLFNRRRRTFYGAAGRKVLSSPPARDAVVEIGGRWINCENRLGIVALHGADRILIHRRTQRRAGRYQSLFTEEICFHLRGGGARCRPGEILSDVGFAVLSGATAAATARVSGGAIRLNGRALRGVWVEGGNGKRYALLANFAPETQTVTVGGEKIELAARTAAVREMITGAARPRRCPAAPRAPAPVNSASGMMGVRCAGSPVDRRGKACQPTVRTDASKQAAHGGKGGMT